MPKELEAIPELPDALRYIWEHYVSLADGRGGSGFGANPISYLELIGWESKRGLRLEWWEVELIKIIDKSYLASQSKGT